jgi:endonuclease YncB( thermonuclease family)
VAAKPINEVVRTGRWRGRSVAGIGLIGAIATALGAWLFGHEGGGTPARLPPSAGAAGSDVVATVLYCHDGDTCRVALPGGLWLAVRLAGIDAPEVASRGRPGQPLGDEARAALTSAVQGRTVRLRQVDLDPYNRPVVEMRLDDAAEARPVNLALVGDGMAEVYRGRTKRLDKSPYLAAEAEAKAAHRGIWGLARYESPSSYRHGAKAR